MISMKNLLPVLFAALGRCATINNFAAQTACSILQGMLPNQVSFPNSAIYNNQSASYWSAQESTLAPACRISANSAQDVSTILNILVPHNTPFAVKSGGHMAWTGAANIDASGVSIDLRGINGIDVVGQTVQLGAGATWGEVYTKLNPLNITVAGARIATAGVGGFLLGGGISFFAPESGFACDSVLSYQVVLANGNIVTASANANADLYVALKGGNNNFGIVTGFTMKTLTPSGSLWGGFQYHQASDLPQLLAATYNFGEQAGTPSSQNVAQDQHSSVILSKCYFQSGNITLIPVTLANTANIANAPILANFTKISSLSGTTSYRTVLSLVKEVDAVAYGQRQVFATYTFKNNLAMMQKVDQVFTQAFLTSGLQNIKGIQLCYSLQPLHKGILRRSFEAGGNSLGLTPQDNLVVTLVEITWPDISTDAFVNAAANIWVTALKTNAQALGLDNSFLYLNYATNTQDPIVGYGPKSQAALRAASSKYDPAQVFQKLVPGGFKLFR